MKIIGRLEIITVGFIIVTSLAGSAGAAITWSGDVDPSDPSTWDSSTEGYIGKTGNGTMGIAGGSDVIVYNGWIGSETGSTGEVTVDGAGSTWTNSSVLFVGYFGNGTLNITGGSAVSSLEGYISFKSDSTSAVTVNGSGSTWTNTNYLYVGRSGNGTLDITDGGAVSNSYGIIGSGSTGEVTVDGADSTWTNVGDLYVGGSGGNGTLHITGGGAVSNGFGYISLDSGGSTGAVTVDGAGSRWTNNDDLFVGLGGDSTLDITGGGLVSIAGLLTIDANGGDDSFINMATGGKLALFGDADGSLVEFMGLIEGFGEIRYWDGSTSGWADITGARYGTDYTLEYLTEGDLAGYTMLTVPEPVIYVDIDAAGANNGQSWADAYTSLPYALGVVLNGDEIRVAQGTYRPNDGVITFGDERELTFQMKNGVTIEGGYAGFGEADPDARDVELYETILSGDLDGNDVDVSDPADLLTEPTRAENSYTVATTGFVTNETVVLDGFTITGGNANGIGHSKGGGMRSGSSPTIINCTFIGNSAHWSGGGMDNSGGTFEDNIATLSNCFFIGNSAGFYGGGINNVYSNPVLNNCVFIGNHSGDSGGGFVDDWCSHSTLTNCTFIDNTADSEGGGMWNYDCCFGEPVITNCIFWGNSDNSGMDYDSQISGCGVVDYCYIQGDRPADPGFVDPNGIDGIAGTQDDDLRLSADSLCIDAGDNSAVTVPTDLDGNQRIANNFVDIGAYEFQGVHEIHVDDDAVGDPGPDDPEISDPGENGTKDHPFDTIQEAVEIAKDGHAVVVLPGLYVSPDIFTQAVSFDKNITLTSTDPTDWDMVEDTVIGGSLSFSGTEGPNCKLTGFKIQNTFFGGISGNGTEATISYCIITGNGPCQSTVINDCDGLISNCLITDNTTFALCGVFPVVFGCNGVIRNCTIANNDSGIGDWSGGSMTLENCIIYNNGDVADPQVSISGGGMLNVSYCNIQDGSQGVDSDGTVNWGWGNIDVDPLFVRWGLWDYGAMELAEGNYHLQSLGWRLSEYDPDWTYDDYTSRCIDAGNPGSPLANELMSVPRDPENYFGINLRVNMGAYGGTAQASMAPYNWALLADLSNDGIVDTMDLAGQAEGWLTNANQQPGDLNRDGRINLADFALLVQDWLQVTGWAE